MADDGTKVDRLLVPGKRDVLVAWEISNHLVGGATAAEATAAMIDYGTASKAAGWRVVVLTVLPRSSPATPAGWPEQSTAANSDLRAAFPIPGSHPRVSLPTGPSWADVLVDVAANPAIGDQGDELETTYYVDRVHMTDAGYAQVAGDVVNGVRQIVG